MSTMTRTLKQSNIFVLVALALSGAIASAQTDQNRPREQQGRGGQPTQRPPDNPERRNPAIDREKERSNVPPDNQAQTSNIGRTTNPAIRGRMQQLRRLRTAMDEELDLTREQAEAVDQLFKAQIHEMGQAEQPATGQPAVVDQRARTVEQINTLRTQRREAMAAGDRQRTRELSQQLRQLGTTGTLLFTPNDQFIADVRTRVPEQQRTIFDDVVQRSFNPAGTAVGLQGSTLVMNALRDVNLDNQQQTLVRTFHDDFVQDLRDPRNQDPLAAQHLLEQLREDVLSELNNEQRATFFAAEERLTPPSAAGNAAMTFAALRSVRLADPQQGTVRTIRERFLQERRDARDPQSRGVLGDQLRQDILTVLSPDQRAEFLDADARLMAELPEGAQPRTPVTGPGTGAGRLGRTTDTERGSPRERERQPVPEEKRP
jgi:hypothetical protein